MAISGGPRRLAGLQRTPAAYANEAALAISGRAGEEGPRRLRTGVRAAPRRSHRGFHRSPELRRYAPPSPRLRGPSAYYPGLRSGQRMRLKVPSPRKSSEPAACCRDFGDNVGARLLESCLSALRLGFPTLHSPAPHLSLSSTKQQLWAPGRAQENCAEEERAQVGVASKQPQEPLTKKKNSLRENQKRVPTKSEVFQGRWIPLDPITAWSLWTLHLGHVKPLSTLSLLLEALFHPLLEPTPPDL
eukprot:XP_017456631.1 PREDICTED: uncharacterized protein LOC108348827 [Rattus norvegicus]